MLSNKSDNKPKVNLSWIPFWTAGFLFTLGYTSLDVTVTATIWQRPLEFLAMYIVWPLILGLSLTGQ